nr:unnamed protein product [Digitaria exilis]
MVTPPAICTRAVYVADAWAPTFVAVRVTVRDWSPPRSTTEMDGVHGFSQHDVPRAVVERRRRSAPGIGLVPNGPAAVRIAAGDHPGCADRSSAAAPLACGHAMDVPDRMLNSVRRASPSSPVGPAAPVHAARMLTPGAMKSGFRISGTSPLGPRAENDATTGAGLTPTTVPPKVMVAVGLEAFAA